jgi:uncharacterized protein YcaQ
MLTIDVLKRFTVARNFPKPTSLKHALKKMGFVQADPIRAPARAQDLILRQRVKGYHAGDIERLYTKLDIEEDFFINYGYVTTALHRLMHPRSNSRKLVDDVWGALPVAQRRKAKLLLQFVNERGTVHPREVEEYFSHGKVTNYWGGSSNATTHLLDALHYHGMVRIVRRDKGIRVYGTRNHSSILSDPNERDRRIDALADVIVSIYGPLPSSTLWFYLRRLRYAVPQWQKALTGMLDRAKQRLPHEQVDKLDWYWPVGEKIPRNPVSDTVRLLAPFDPLVHDRARFELLWGWSYRFEAYTPATKRKLGYYAMPMLWRDAIVGWANLSVKGGRLAPDIGFVGEPIRERTFKQELERELESLTKFLRLNE